MDLVTYCRLVGIQIDTAPPIGVWSKYRTDDKPHHKNGRVKNMGTYAHVQNMATMSECDTWKPEDGDAAPTIDHAEVARVIEKQRLEREQAAQKAARLAGWVMNQCRLETHPYLVNGGFPEEQGNVWTREKDGERKKLLVIPMRIDGNIVGCQLIDEVGSKKFLTGQRTDGAVYVMDNRGLPILVEGYRKALAVRVALKALKRRYRIIVTFSAGNLARIAKDLPDCFIVADLDEPSAQVPTYGGMGLKVAKESGRPYWISNQVGQDFDKYLRDVGVFKASQALRTAMG